MKRMILTFLTEDGSSLAVSRMGIHSDEEHDVEVNCIGVVKLDYNHVADLRNFLGTADDD